MAFSISIRIQQFSTIFYWWWLKINHIYMNKIVPSAQLSHSIYIWNEIQTFYFNYYMLIPFEIPQKLFPQVNTHTLYCVHTTHTRTHTQTPVRISLVWSNEWEKQAIYLTLNAQRAHTCLNMELYSHCLFGAYFLISFLQRPGTCRTTETWYFHLAIE